MRCRKTPLPPSIRPEGKVPSIARYIAAVLVVTCALAGGSTGYAEAPPEEIAETIAEAAKICRSKGGTPETAAVLRGDDLSGDGRADWIADFSKLKCDKATNPACNPSGCLLQLYYRDGEDWDKVFEDFVKSYKFSSSGTTRTMHVITSGIPCNKPPEDRCSYNYRLDKEAVTPVR